MGQTGTPLQVFNSAEPIPGYVIRERIGTGGYGEVWKADAPGGLTKAIKFVYGHLNDVRATRELKSLNQIKEVRHPFLLSLERIEVIDGHLIIVTELAETSLKEHFDRCRETGLPGIPRDELLGYLRDAADALDYIYENYSLQHLDVKPENLLLLGGRIKVADFGLLKNLHDGSASLMGGLTPLYSPPELFDGRPNHYSDQYSLAVVFQEMLTGTPPFAGRTAAQLAAQHLHSRPALALLPLADQRVIGRALAKDPNKRFATCRALVDALLDPRHAMPGKGMAGSTIAGNLKRPTPGAGLSHRKPSSGGEKSASQPPTKTELLDDNFLAADLDADTAVDVSVPAVVTSLPPIELTGQDARFRPTVFLGIGGTGARTLRRLRRRLHDRFGDLDSVPALQMLLLDTNLKAMSEATRGERGVALTDRETIGLPLRRAEDYRADSKKLLSWMSRRWIYNIPRSLQTEGLRPLGRLAFIDRASYVMDRIRESIVTATDAGSVAATSAATRLAFCPGAVRVFVIASISGGTGSGMVLDVAYAVRQILAELGLSDEDVCGILGHATDRKASTRDLAIANAYACLSELRHYSDRGNSYPGDSACGLPAFQADDFTFPNAYLVHLGDELNEEEFDAATDDLAEYLFLNAVTPAGAFFDKCRELDHLETETDSRPATLRTFGLSQIGGCNSDIPSRAAEILCKTLVHRWRGDVNAELEIRPPKLSETGSLVEVSGAAKVIIDPNIEHLAAEHARALQLNVDHLIQMVYDVVEREMGSDAETYFSNVVEESLARFESRPLEDRNRPATVQILGTIDAILGIHGDEDDNEELPFQSLHDVLDRTIAEPAAELGTAIREWILDLVDTSSARINGAQHASKWFAEHLVALEKTALERLQHQLGELAALKAVLADSKAGDAASRKMRGSKRVAVDPRLSQYFKLRLREVVLRGVSKLLRLIQGQITAGSDQLRDLWRDLNRLAEQFRVPSSLEQAGTVKNAGSPGDAWSALFETLWSRKTELVVELDQALEAELFSTKGRLRRLLTEGVDVRGTLTVALRAAARTVVLRAMKQINVANMVDPSDDGSVSESASLGSRLESATPRLLRCGGAKRLLLVAPDGTDQARLQQELRGETEDAPTVVSDSGGDVILCYEAEQLPIDKVAAMLAEHRQDYAKIASRLHTRIDVDWS